MESVGVILGRIIDLSQDHLRPQHDEKVVNLLDAHVQAVIGTVNERMMSASKETSIQVIGGRNVGNGRGAICVRSLAFPTHPNLAVMLWTHPLPVFNCYDDRRRRC